MKIRFTKMHGLGNDFILIDDRDSSIGNLPEFSQKICNRRYGIGADQVLLLNNSDIADFRMQIFNADGSEVEMCGNGIRCLAKYVWDRNLSDKNILSVETLGGIVRPEKAGDMVKVDMGEPIFDPKKIPVDISVGGEHIIDYPLSVGDREFLITCVSMGNPHAVIFVDDLSDFGVTYYGPIIETHALFPKRTNVEFIQIVSLREIQMRVWERGSGETLACGTGASAAAVASNLKGLAERTVTVRLQGGNLVIDWATDNHVYMTGPAVEVFHGELNT